MPTGQNTAEVSPGTAPTAGNSGGTSGTALSSISVGAASTILVQAAALIHGTRGYAFTLAGSGTDGATRILWPIAETGRLVFSFYVTIGVAITALEDLGGIRNASGNMGVIQVGADGKLIMADAAGTNIAASKAPNVCPTGTVRVDVACAPGTTTSNGVLGYAYYLGDDNTAVYSWESSAVNTGTAAIAFGFIGRSTGRTVARTLNYDTIRWATTTTGFMDRYVDPGGVSGTITQLGSNIAEGIPIGTSLTSASASLTGGASGTAASAISVGAASTITVSNFNVVHGSRGYVFTLAGSTGDGATRMLFPCVRSDRVVLSFYIGELSALPGATEDLGGIRNSAGNMCILSIGADGKLIMSDAAGGVSASRATNVLPIQTKIRIDISVAKGTTTANGVCGYSYYLGNSDTPVFVWEDSARNTGTTDTATVFVGRSTGRANPTTLYIDTLRWGWGASGGWFQHYVAPKTAPYADLGGDVNDIEPYSTVTLNCSNSFDIDGTLASYTLTQISGPTATVSGSGPTFTYKAPGGIAAAAIGWQLIVTDNDGLTSSAVSVTHNILPVNEMAAIASAWVPVEVSTVKAGEGGGSSGMPTPVWALWYNIFNLPRLRSIPSDVLVTTNHYILAMAQSQVPGTGNLMFGTYNGETVAELKADVLARRAAGANVCIGVGGSDDGGITITNSTQVTQAYNSIVGFVTTYGINGLDIDLEPSGSSWNQASIVSLVSQLRATYGTSFVIGVTPGLYDPYTAPWIALCLALGTNLDYVAPMLYDFPEARDSRLNAVAVDKCNTLVSGGVPQTKIILGFMLRAASTGSGYNASTPQVILDAYNAAVAVYPNLRGAFLWEQYLDSQNTWGGSRGLGKRIRGV